MALPKPPPPPPPGPRSTELMRRADSRSRLATGEDNRLPCSCCCCSPGSAPWLSAEARSRDATSTALAAGGLPVPSPRWLPHRPVRAALDMQGEGECCRRSGPLPAAEAAARRCSALAAAIDNEPRRLSWAVLRWRRDAPLAALVAGLPLCERPRCGLRPLLSLLSASASAAAFSSCAASSSAAKVCSTLKKAAGEASVLRRALMTPPRRLQWREMGARKV